MTYVTRSAFFFFNDTATTEIYTLSLHDALPISGCRPARYVLEDTDHSHGRRRVDSTAPGLVIEDRKSTRLNSSHANISYAVFCLKKKHLRRHGIAALCGCILVPPDKPYCSAGPW